MRSSQTGFRHEICPAKSLSHRLRVLKSHEVSVKVSCVVSKNCSVGLVRVDHGRRCSRSH